MREEAKTVHDVAKVLKNNSRFCFLIADIINQKMTCNHGHVLLSPSDTCDLTLDPDTANIELTLCEDNKKATWSKAVVSWSPTEIRLLSSGYVQRGAHCALLLGGGVEYWQK